MKILLLAVLAVSAASVLVLSEGNEQAQAEHKEKSYVKQDFNQKSTHHQKCG